MVKQLLDLFAAFSALSAPDGSFLVNLQQTTHLPPQTLQLAQNRSNQAATRLAKQCVAESVRCFQDLENLQSGCVLGKLLVICA